MTAGVVAGVIAGLTLLWQVVETVFYFTLACPSVTPDQSGAERFPSWSWAPPGALCATGGSSGAVTPSWIPIVVVLACSAVGIVLTRRGRFS